ncbi:uncharacterized protein LOC108999276 [Juglans regia]|nr:uncharacterized protein LOC108999276 [Juglans regia]
MIDAIRFVHLVKETFKDNPEIYRRFIQSLKDYRERRFHTRSLQPSPTEPQPTKDEDNGGYENLESNPKECEDPENEDVDEGSCWRLRSLLILGKEVRQFDILLLSYKGMLEKVGNGYVQAALVLGGVHVTGPHLHTRYIPMDQPAQPFATMGYGSLAAMAIFGSKYREGLTVN